MSDLKTLRLVRHKQDSWMTLGRLFAADGEQICVTLERPWVDLDKDGRRDENVSRIAPGTYHVKLRHDSPKHGTVYELQDVPDTKNAQIHVANWPTQLKGCIATGTAFGDATIGGVSKPGVTGSKTAYDKFMREMNASPEFLLTIIDSYLR